MRRVSCHYFVNHSDPSCFYQFASFVRKTPCPPSLRENTIGNADVKIGDFNLQRNFADIHAIKL
jgi:hypothetical protein